MKRAALISLVIAFLASPIVAAAGPDKTSLSWWNRDTGWRWELIPTGWKLKATGAFDLPTYLYPGAHQQTVVGTLPTGEICQYAGKEIDGWVEIEVKGKHFWVDYRSIEPLEPK